MAKGYKLKELLLHQQEKEKFNKEQEFRNKKQQAIQSKNDLVVITPENLRSKILPSVEY